MTTQADQEIPKPDDGITGPDDEAPVCKYEIPDLSKAAQWQTNVNQAISEGALKWQRVLANKWVLTGNCPRCEHKTSSVHDFDVIIPKSLGGDRYEMAAEPFMTEVICACAEEHAKNKSGCGYGRGLRIKLDQPRGRT